MYPIEQQNLTEAQLDSTSDIALMNMVKNGDLDKLGILFERYHSRLFGFFYRLTWCKNSSEDLVQGVFERILKYRSSYTSDGEFSTWIFSIARNHFHDYYRKNGSEVVEPKELDWDAMPGEELQDRERSDEECTQLLIRQALQQLDTEKRQVLILSRFEGLKYTEIAEVMNCTEGAVKVRAFRALNELKGILTDLKKKEEI